MAGPALHAAKRSASRRPCVRHTHPSMGMPRSAACCLAVNATASSTALATRARPPTGKSTTDHDTSAIERESVRQRS